MEKIDKYCMCKYCYEFFKTERLKKFCSDSCRSMSSRKNNMKTTIIAILLLLSSCAKEEVCNCGLVVDDKASDYSVKIRNSCTKNEKWFYLQPGDWMNAHVGDDYCITNVDKW